MTAACRLCGRQYARAVVDVLDPGGRLFGQRIIAQGLPGEALLDKSKRLMEGLEVPIWVADRLTLVVYQLSHHHWSGSPQQQCLGTQRSAGFVYS